MAPTARTRVPLEDEEGPPSMERTRIIRAVSPIALCPGLVLRIIGWRQRRAAVHALMALDGATLKDLGLHVSEVPSLVAECHAAAARSRRQAGP